jgi:hypothetical protein
MVCDACATDRNTPWRDASRATAAPKAVVWYRVRGNGAGPASTSGPWSAASPTGGLGF